MADEKKYSAREAAIAVLAKAEEMLKSSKHKHIGWDKLHSKLEHEGYSKESSDKIAGSIKAKVQKAEGKDENEIGTKFVKAEGEGKKDESMAGDKKAPSNSNKPRIEEKATERDYQDFEPKAGHAPENDHRQAQQAAPGNNPKEQSEGNNADWGTSPQVKGHIKLAHFMGHAGAKKQNQKNNNTGTAMGQPPAAGIEKAEAAPKMKKGIALS